MFPLGMSQKPILHRDYEVGVYILKSCRYLFFFSSVSTEGTD